MSYHQHSDPNPMAGPSSSMQTPISPAKPTFSEQDNQPHSRLIPIHFRLVPKDIWVRMHVDTRATIGSVKDALLEKLQLPSYDPSLQYYFYEEARLAMSRQSATQSEVKSFPKAFVARTPKRNLKEIKRAEREATLSSADSTSIHSSSKTAKSINVRRTPNIKQIPTSAQARAILGGDPGIGGRGSMGFVGFHLEQRESWDDENFGSSQTDHSTQVMSGRPKVIGSKSRQRATSTQTNLNVSSDAIHRTIDNSNVAIVTSSNVADTSDTNGNDSKRRTAAPSTPINMLKRPSTSQTGTMHHDDERQQGSESETHDDPTRDAGLDAYGDYYGVGLFGNEEAKNQEEAAMAKLRAMDTTLSARSSSAPSGLALSPTTPSPYMGRLPNNLNAFQSPSYSSSPHPTPSLRNTDDEDVGEDELVDPQKAFDELVQRSGSVSVHSISSSDSLAERGEEKEDQHNPVPSHPTPHSNVIDQSPSKGKGNGSNRSISPASSKSVARERARSGTIIASDVQKNKPAALPSNAMAIIEANSFDSPAPSTIHTSSSESQIPEEDMMKLPRSRIPTNSSIEERQRSNLVTNTTTLATMDDSIGQTTFASLYGQSMTGTSSNNHQGRRLAGIYTDEISSWRDAQHAQAKYYAVHSYSNGHILEDWRTVAALRIRPFELLEIQYADPHDKIHLPRFGEASDSSASKIASRMQMKEREENQNSTFNEVRQSDLYRDLPNPSLEHRYLEPFAEAWCYIFKRGGGTSKAQKAGLGLWKLRWISLRGKKLSIYRTKHLRQGYDEAMNIWNLASIESVITERADGVTRPVLMPINGICQDILTINFARAFIPPNSIHDEASDYQQAILSMRFITQVDHCAFFRCFARAHLHTALQSQDPFQSAMVFEWRRKAMARAVIAGMGGTVLPGKAGRRGGRNALSRQRLRPMGLSRDFDDADRWSSDSDGEDIPSASSIAAITSLLQYSDDGSARGPRDSNSGSGGTGFLYTSACLRPLIQSSADISGLSIAPSLPSMRYFGSDADVFYDNSSTAGGDQSSILHGTGSPPPVREMSRFDQIRSSPASKTYSSGYGQSPLRDQQIGSGSSDGHRRSSAANFKTGTSYNMNEIRSPPMSSSGPPSSPGDKQNQKRNLSSSKLMPRDRSISVAETNRDKSFALAPSSPNGGGGETRSRTRTNPFGPSTLPTGLSDYRSPPTSSPIQDSPSLKQQTLDNSNTYSRSIVSNISAAEEQSPAAQAIHSFLAQRSASNATTNSRNQSQPFGSPYSNSSFQFDDGKGVRHGEVGEEIGGNGVKGFNDVQQSMIDGETILSSVSALSEEQANRQKLITSPTRTTLSQENQKNGITAHDFALQ